MRGFFGAIGSKDQLTSIVNRYLEYRTSLDDTRFVDVMLPELYLSHWLHDGNNQTDIDSRQLFDHLNVIGWASLYESVELKSKLNLEGKFSSLELIQHAWNKWGSDCLDHLEGDFSFIVWDARTEELFLVKDQMGIRPLFYAKINDVLVFGSTIPVLKSVFPHKPALNERYIAMELKNYPQPVETTFFQDIHRLKPAHYIKLSTGKRTAESPSDGSGAQKDQEIHGGQQSGAIPGGRSQSTKGQETFDNHYEHDLTFTEQRYWELTPTPLPIFKTDQEYIELVREEMISAIQRRIEGIDLVGCQLSGGMDSSAIAVILSRIMDKEKLYTYSFVLSEKTRPYSERGIDEQGTQEAILEYADLRRENHRHIEEFHYKDVFDELNTINRVMGGLANSDTIWQDTLFKTAAKDGIKVSFSGFPGDEGISNPGSKYYHDYILQKNWMGLLTHLVHFHVRGVKNIIDYFRFKRNGTFKLNYTEIQKSRNLLTESSHWHKELRDTSFEFKPGYKTWLKEQMCRPHTALRTESEGAYANQYGIETRYPLADIRLLRLVYSLPLHLFRPKPYSRALFRNICKGILPDKVRLQPKFSGAMTLAFAEYWMKKSQEELSDYEIKPHTGLFASEVELQNQDIGIPDLKNHIQTRRAGLKKIDYLIGLNV